jgi:rhodanese-related sulfurtransferase
MSDSLFKQLGVLIKSAVSQAGSDVGGVKMTTVQGLKEAMKTDPDLVVLDVRSAAELCQNLGCLDNVINIPVNELRHRIGELEHHRDNDVYVICASGARSLSASAMLARAGYRSINVQGGMSAWRRAYGQSGR